MTRAVVFAYHNVGVRCLEVLIRHGVEVTLVVTHDDNPGETIWFDSVARTATQHAIPVITPSDPNAQEVVERIAAMQTRFPVLLLLPSNAQRDRCSRWRRAAR